jgi:thymidylate kinase
MSNPFSTRFIRPGAIPFIFSDGASLESLVERLEQQAWWGQITGPHGSGKSTLLAALTPRLEAAGRSIAASALHQGQHRLQPLDRSSLRPNSLLIIDGYEQLSWWQRRRMKSLCRRTGAGLLVTAHRDAGLPTLYRTEPTEYLAKRIVARLIPNTAAAISDEDIAAAFAATRGDLRETLFRLYDVYQSRSHTAK